MARQMLKPFSFLLYVLSFVCGFFVGVSVAGFVDAGKGQMLAGGAIVLSYGVFAAIIGFLIALFIANKARRKDILRINAILTIAIIGFWAYFYIGYKEREKAKGFNEQETKQPKKLEPVAPAAEDEIGMLVPYHNIASDDYSFIIS